MCLTLDTRAHHPSRQYIYIYIQTYNLQLTGYSLTLTSQPVKNSYRMCRTQVNINATHKPDSVDLDASYVMHVKKRTKPNTYLGLGATQHLFRPEMLLVLLKRKLNTFGGDVNDHLTLSN